MEMMLAVLIFVAIALAVFAFGAAVYAPSSVLGARLRALGSQRAQVKEPPAIKQRIEQALDPLSKALPLSPDDSDRTRAWLIQAGYREARHLTMFLGIRVLVALVATSTSVNGRCTSSMAAHPPAAASSVVTIT